MQYVNRTFGLFDTTKPVVATRQMTLLGHEVTGGQVISSLKDENDVPIDSDVLRRLWLSRWADYESDYTPTPELETHGPGREWMDEAEGVAVTEADGVFTIRAAWLGEDGETVEGEEAAQDRAAEVRLAGDTYGIGYAHSGGGWYLITGPGVPADLKVKGEEAAKAKAEELRAAHRPLEPVSETDALVVITVEDDDFIVTAPWLEAPERFAEAEAADARQAELRQDGPPEGWVASAENPTGE